MSSPLLLGITGGIGSGKSTVCRVFEHLGTQIYYADDRAKWLMSNDQKLIVKIIALFGEEAYQNGILNRTFIAGLTFNNKELLSKLNEAVHPCVANDFRLWVSERKDQKALVKEAALLFEAGSYKQLDKNILVTSPKDLKIERILARDPHRNVQQVEAIMNNQMVDSEKHILADDIIQNDERRLILPQVLEIYSKYFS